jgi:hypothetical protein
MQDNGMALRFRASVFMAAGLAGGLAEVLWVSLYSSLTPMSAVAVAREVAASVFPQAAFQPGAPLLGLMIHFALSLVLGLAIGAGLLFTGRRRDFATMLALLIGALTLVWLVNFFAILPLLNPRFAVLMPYSVTLLSKVLFAVAMACVLQLAQAPEAKSHGAYIPRLKMF